MHVDPDQRLTAQQALATPWVATGGLGRSDDLGGEARRGEATETNLSASTAFSSLGRSPASALSQATVACWFE